MGSNRVTRRRGMRRDGLCAAAMGCLALAALLAGGCGGTGAAATESQKAADLQTLDSILGDELTSVQAYERGLRLLRHRLRPLGRQLLAQDQEDVDAITKAIRGLGGKAVAEADPVDFSTVKSGGEFLRLAYGLEGAALGSCLDATKRLFTPAPRGLAASLAAGHAQRLVVLRQALGAGLPAAVPRAFDGGDVPPPGRG